MGASSTLQSPLSKKANDTKRGKTKIQTGNLQFTHPLMPSYVRPPQDQLDDDLRRCVQADDEIKAEQRKSGCKSGWVNCISVALYTFCRVCEGSVLCFAFV